MQGINFSAKVHFIAGKGGVGKSLIARALASYFSRKEKTLLIELSENETGDEHPHKASIKKEVAAGYDRVRIYPDQALYEYLCLKAPSQRMLDAIMSQNLFRAICSAMPGVSDLTRLGKVWFHADEAHGEKAGIYEKIVVDMPSSGFVGRFISIPHVVSKAVRIGPLAKEARLIHNYFKDGRNARIHLVSLLEELVVNETIELYEQISSLACIQWGSLFINRILPFDRTSSLSLSKSLGKTCPNIDGILARLDARVMREGHDRQRFVECGVGLSQMEVADHVGFSSQEDIVKEILSGFFENGSPLDEGLRP